MFNEEEKLKSEETIIEEESTNASPLIEKEEGKFVEKLEDKVQEEIESHETKEETKTDEVKEETKIDEEKGDSKESSKKSNSFEPVSKDLLPENFNPFERPVNPRFANRREQEFTERVLQIKRVIKVTKGGRRFKFSALVVVGDRKGRVGYAIGKHIEVPEAIKKAVRQAKKNIISVKIVGKPDTIPHEVIGHKGAARVMLKPAVEGKGIIASDIVRAVVELAGYRNIYSKNLGTSNPLNVVIATTEALKLMRTKEEIEALKKNFPKYEKKPIEKVSKPIEKKIDSVKEELKESKGE